MPTVREKQENESDQPRHLMTIAQAFGEKKQITINCYFEEASEIAPLLEASRLALDIEEADFQKKLEAAQTKFREAQVESNNNNKEKKNGR